MGRKKSKNRMYFDDVVENAIVQYQQTESIYTRDKLFSTIIYPAFNKMVENVIHKWKFYNYESNYSDLKSETITYLYEQINKYKPETGSRAFSYFTIITKNFCIKKAKEMKEINKISNDLGLVDVNRNIMVEVTREKYTESVSEFTAAWMKHITKNINDIFKTDRDRSIALAFFNTLNDSYDFDIFNKKIIYVFIKEQTGVENSTYITKVINILRDSFKGYMKKYTNYFEYE